MPRIIGYKPYSHSFSDPLADSRYILNPLTGRRLSPLGTSRYGTKRCPNFLSDLISFFFALFANLLLTTSSHRNVLITRQALTHRAEKTVIRRDTLHYINGRKLQRTLDCIRFFLCASKLCCLQNATRATSRSKSICLLFILVFWLQMPCSHAYNWHCVCIVVCDSFSLQTGYLMRELKRERHINMRQRSSQQAFPIAVLRTNGLIDVSCRQVLNSLHQLSKQKLFLTQLLQLF